MWRGGLVLWRCGGARGGRVDFLVQMEKCLVCSAQDQTCSVHSQLSDRVETEGAACAGGRERGNLVAAESSFHDNHYFNDDDPRAE